MPTRPRRPPIARLRRLLLVLLIAGLAVVAVVFVVRRRADPPPGPDDDAGPRPEGEITLIGEGFEFTQSEGERPVFRIRGESVKVRRGNVVLLEDVGLTLYDEDGTPYHVEAEEASYDRESRDATLSGALRLIGPDGMVLTARGMTWRNQGGLVRSRGPVELLYGGAYRGTADRFFARINRDLFVLAGHAEVIHFEGPTPVVLSANTINFRRDEDLVYALDNVELRRAFDRLTTDRLNLYLAPGGGRITAVRARGAVAGRIRLGRTAGAGGGDGTAAGGDAAADDDARAPSTLRIRGDSLFVEFGEQTEPQRAELEGLPAAPATAVSAGEGLDQTLAARRIEVRFGAGGGQEMVATGSPRLTETAAGAASGAPPLREVTANRMTAGFGAGGDLERVGAEGDVDYRAADLEAQGDRMTYAAAEAEAELFGDPVRVVSERGVLLAPHVVYEQESGLLRAEGGVRAVLEEDSGVGLDGSPLASGEGPVRIESEEAFWRDRPTAVLFRGDVRAWRAESLLVAAELRGDRQDGAEVLTASGGVKTVWTGAPGEDGAGAEESEETAGGARQPVEVTARTMVYRRPEGSPRGAVVYDGGVRSTQGERTLTCRRLEVALDDDGRAERMTCTGEVRLEDRAAGNVATGERAVYDLAARTVDITGEPVVLIRDGAGEGGRSEVRGRRVLYEVDAGRARVLAGGREPGLQESPPPDGTTAAPPPATEGGG